MARRARITHQEELEIAQLYREGASPKEIKVSYNNLSESTFYRVLKKYDVPVRRGMGRVVPQKQLPAPTIVAVDDLSYNVDAQGTVQTAQRQPQQKRANVSLWDVKYTGEMVVEAESIDQALSEARKISTVRRIYSVRVKS